MGSKSKTQALTLVTWVEVLSLSFFVRREPLHLARRWRRGASEMVAVKAHGLPSVLGALLSNYSVKNKTPKLGDEK